MDRSQPNSECRLGGAAILAAMGTDRTPVTRCRNWFGRQVFAHQHGTGDRLASWLIPVYFVFLFVLYIATRDVQTIVTLLV